jgi:hypothetical protein
MLWNIISWILWFKNNYSSNKIRLIREDKRWYQMYKKLETKSKNQISGTSVDIGGGVGSRAGLLLPFDGLFGCGFELAVAPGGSGGELFADALGFASKFPVEGSGLRAAISAAAFFRRGDIPASRFAEGFLGGVPANHSMVESAAASFAVDLSLGSSPMKKSETPPTLLKDKTPEASFWMPWALSSSAPGRKFS